MNNLIVNINKSHALHKVEDTLNNFCNAIYKKNDEIEELKEKLKKSEKERVKLARAYAKKLGVLMTKKKYKKIQQNRHK